ncbi:MAG: hypothetical protein IPF55_11595 [Rhodoferax sp.]|nr:hypothetical protein [Rhodoferax sp.]
MAELALQAGSAAEALKVMEQGYAAGVLGTGDKAAEQQRFKDKAPNWSPRIALRLRKT